MRYRWPLLLVVANNVGLVAESMKLEDVHAGRPGHGRSADFGALVRFGGERLVRALDDLRAATREWVDNPYPSSMRESHPTSCDPFSARGGPQHLMPGQSGVPLRSC